MIRILYTADMHLASPLRSLALRDPELRDRVRTSSRTTLTRIVDIAVAEDGAALLIAGELFDGAERSARTAGFLMLQLERLSERGIRVFYIKGNHDAENPLTGELSLPDNVHVFDAVAARYSLQRASGSTASALPTVMPRKACCQGSLRRSQARSTSQCCIPPSRVQKATILTHPARSET